MQVTAEPLDLKPPRPGRWLGPMGLALIAHLLLMGALTWGVRWQSDTPPVTFEAELWSRLPQEAAPRAVEPPPPPPPPPEPEPKPQPKPQPEPKPEPTPPAVKQADIATAQAKKKQLEEDRREAEEQKAKQVAKKEAEEKARKAEKQKAEELQKKTEARKLAEQQKLDQDRKEAKRREEQAAEKRYKENVARMMGQAGASGGPEARGSAQRSSGPSSSYGAKVAAKIRPNIIPTRDYPSDLETVIYLRLLPDGTIASRRISQSSGNAAWDDEALRAIDRTRTVPRDTDGSVPPYGEVVLSPND
jgi:colicin import membrane protein